jgi:D-lactate dehydrogenase (cytochrome)
MTATAPAYPRAAIPASLIEGLSALVGDRLTTSRAICEAHGRDESFHPAVAPDAVVFATSTEEVAAVVRLCAAHKAPIIPFGVGTSLEGHVAALRGGVCIDLSRMNAILEVNEADLDCRVQAGVTRKQLNEHLRDTGLFFPIDPGADATIGGMTATRASGTNAVRYGTMRENVLGLTAVTAAGEIIRTGGRARKSSAGYDLTRLLVGSEGTLAVITEVQLRLYGIPEAISAAVCAFPSLADAVNTVIQTIQMGIPVARVELLERTQMGAVIAYSKLEGFREADTLFFEFHGSPASVAEQAEAVGAIARENGGDDFKWASRPEERSALWQARHEAYYAALSLRPGSKGWPTDVCVPISRLAECITETKADIDASGVIAPIVGHVGDGNFHLVFLVNPDDPEELRRAAAVNERMVARALAMGGTCTGEHGIGYGKIACLEQEHGAAVEVMRTIKRALDPDNLMNPGKVLRI